jgi:hypothetical protein
MVTVVRATGRLQSNPAAEGADGSSVVQREETEMAYGIVHQFAGGTEEQYKASIAAVPRATAACPRDSNSTRRGGRPKAG